MPTLERTNPLPLYYQLKEVLRQQIRAGHLAPHTAIPSEPELVASYRVSRATVRQALTELVNEGLLYRQHGKGTYVCEPRVQQTLSELASLTDELKRRGKRPGGLLLIDELVRVAEGSLYQLMTSEGLGPYIAEYTIAGGRASARESELLQLQPDEPGLRFTCTAFDQTGLPIEYSELFFAGTRYEFQVTLRVSK